MDDHLKSGIGGEVTDQAIDASTLARQLWKLTPLPLTQVDIIYSRPRGPRGSARSLHSLCLATISENLHLYGAESFAGVPPALIRRVFARVRADRRYPDEAGTQHERVALRPDEVTIWSMHAAADPEGMASFQPSHSLGLPITTTLQHLTPNLASDPPEHPFNAIPKLYRAMNPSPTIPFLTTLSLDGMGGLVNDETMVPLRYCTHLTLLSTRHCSFTDAGVRFLSSLQLPGRSGDEGMGMWRLQAWSLMGCWGVSDRSMKVLARWPGLVMLDVRNTSCTDAAMGVFNRTQQALFSCANADFQPCTDGLRGIFASKCPASVIVERLSHTLLKRKRDGTATPEPYLALHLLPSTQTMHPTWLPDRPWASLLRKNGPDRIRTSSQAYIGGGVGQLYGTNVRAVEDEARQFRRKVKSALDIKAKLDKKALLESQYRNVRREDWDWDWVPDKERDAMWKRHRKEGGRWGWSKEHAAGKVFGKKRGARVEAEARAPIPDRVDMYWQKVRYDDREVIEGEPCYMMVRMVCDHWETLVWAADAGAKLAKSSNTVGTQGMTAAAALFKLGSQRKRGDLVGDILSTAGPALELAFQSQSSSTSNPFAPSRVAAASSSRASQPKQQIDSHAEPSSSAPSSSPASQPFTPAKAAPVSARPSNPFRSAISIDREPTLPSSSTSPPDGLKENADDFTSFAYVPSKKRTFGGAAGGEQKRRGMKMFSGARL